MNFGFLVNGKVSFYEASLGLSYYYMLWILLIYISRVFNKEWQFSPLNSLLNIVWNSFSEFLLNFSTRRASVPSLHQWAHNPKLKSSKKIRSVIHSVTSQFKKHLNISYLSSKTKKLCQIICQNVSNAINFLMNYERKKFNTKPFSGPIFYNFFRKISTHKSTCLINMKLKFHSTRYEGMTEWTTKIRNYYIRIRILL